MMAETLRVRFSFLADNVLGPVTDYDVAMAYEFFLARSPENSAAINSHKQRRFDDMIRVFVQSGEFSAATYQKLKAGHPINRLDNTRSPSRQQTLWITKKMILTEEEKNKLYNSSSWEELFNNILIDEEPPTSEIQPSTENAIIAPIYAEIKESNNHDIMIAIKNIEVLINDIKSMIRS